MATLSWSSRLSHGSDALFREYGQELENKLVEAGLVKTSDTGQIDWTTATRSSINTLTAGYLILRFNDTMQATAPIYLRIDFGTGSSSNFPRIALTVGTGTDGSGTITGDAKTSQRVWATTGTAPDGLTARQSWLCVTEGFVGLMWKDYGETSTIGGAFFVSRTCDSSGTPSATGAIVNWGSGAVSTIAVRQSLRFAATADAYTATTNDVTSAMGINPQGQVMTAIDGDIQCALGFITTPRAEPINTVCGVLENELNQYGTFKATLIGTQERTYITCNGKMGPFGPISLGDSGAMRCAMLWE